MNTKCFVNFKSMRFLYLSFNLEEFFPESQLYLSLEIFLRWNIFFLLFLLLIHFVISFAVILIFTLLFSIVPNIIHFNGIFFFYTTYFQPSKEHIRFINNEWLNHCWMKGHIFYWVTKRLINYEKIITRGLI